MKAKKYSVKHLGQDGTKVQALKRIDFYGKLDTQLTQSLSDPLYNIVYGRTQGVLWMGSLGFLFDLGDEEAYE